MKQALRESITAKIDALEALSNGNSCSLFIHADVEEKISHMHLKGKSNILAMAFGNKMEHNEEFRRIMLSILGSYLTNNPKHKEEFLAALDMDSNHPINLN